MRLKQMTLKKNLFKKNFDWIAIILFIFLPWIIFGFGIDLFQNALAAGDGLTYGVPVKEFLSQNNLWNPLTEGGTFFIRESGAQAGYLPAIGIMNLLPCVFGFNVLLMVHYAAAGIFTYYFLKTLGQNKIAAFFGGVAFMFSGFLCAHLGHHNMIMASIYLPAVLLFIELNIKTKKFLYLFLGAIMFYLSITADYWATPMYIGMIAIPYIIFRCIRAGRANKQKAAKIIVEIIKILLVIFVGGLLLSSFYIAVIFQSLPLTLRSTIDYAFFSSYSFDAYLAPMQLFPFIFNQNFAPLAFYGPWNITEIFGYMPILVLVVGLTAFITLRKKESQLWFWMVILAFAVLLVLGESTPFYKIAYKIPIYNMFRVPGRNWFEANFALSMLFAFGINGVARAEKEKLMLFAKKALRVSVYVAVAAVLILLILFSLRPLMDGLSNTSLTLPNFYYSVKDISAFFNKYMTLKNPEIFIPIIIIALSVTQFWLIKKYGIKKILVILFCGVLFFDISVYAHNITGIEPVGTQNSQIVEYLQSNDPSKSDYRIYPMEYGIMGVSQMSNLSNGFAIINGYSSVPLKDYVALAKFNNNGVSFQPTMMLQKNSLLSAMSTKYIVTGQKDYKELLDIAADVRDMKTEKEIVGTSEQWDKYLASVDNGEYQLESTQNNFALLQKKITVEQKSYYKVEFDMCGSNNGSINVDLYDKDFGRSSDTIDVRNLGAEYVHFSVILFSGNMPNTVLARVISNGEAIRSIKNISVSKMTEGKKIYQKFFEDQNGNAVYYNTNWVPRASFPSRLIPVNNGGDVDYRFNLVNDIVPGRDACVEGIGAPGDMGKAEVLSEDYSNFENVKLRIQLESEKAFLVLSDTYYPGWEAYVDGVKQTIYKTNGIMRGVFVSGTGDHTVEFRFIPTLFYIGILISVITASVFTMICMLESKKERRRMKEKMALDK